MEFIFIILITCVLALYLVQIIARLKDQVEAQVKKDVDRLAAVYDDILEEKSKELEELEERIAELKNMEAVESSEYFDGYGGGYSSVVLLNKGSFVNHTFFKQYGLVKKEFHDISYEAMKEVVFKLMRTRRDINVHEYKELLSIFDFDLQYEMTSLDSNSQLEIMDMIFGHSMGKRRVLQQYIDQYGTFSLIGFMDYLRTYIFYHDSVITVYSHTGQPCIENAPKNIVFKEDSSIGEGYIVRFRDKSYDFSLKDA